MENADPSLLKIWMDAWRDLVHFEVIPVVSSAEASERFGGSKPTISSGDSLDV